MLNLLKFIDARMGEPSTYASISGLLIMVNVNVDPGVMHAVTLWGGVFAGVLGVVLAEIGDGKSAGQIGNDALKTLAVAIKAMPPATTALLLLCGAGLWRFAAAIAMRMTIVTLLLCGAGLWRFAAAIAMRMTIVMLALFALVSVSACTSSQIVTGLTAAGVSSGTAQTVASDTVEAGTLFCRFGPTIAAVTGVKVNGATSAAVAAACGQITVAGVAQPGAVPVPPPATPAPVPVATVAADVAAAVIASIGK